MPNAMPNEVPPFSFLGFVAANPIAISASVNILFPLPDSPTNPTHSPAPIRSDTAFTGRTPPKGVGNSTVNLKLFNSPLAIPSWSQQSSPHSGKKGVTSRKCLPPS
jgi:hypothetical protein